MGIFELFGVALIYPFILKLLTDSPKYHIWDNPIFLGFVIISLFLLKNIFMIFYTFLQAKFTKTLEKEINLRFLQYFLTVPYQLSAKISLSEKQNILGFVIPNVINNYIMRLLNLNVNIFIFCLISSFLVFKYTMATIITIIFATLIITVQSLIFKPILFKISKIQHEVAKTYSQRTNEAIINIKSLKVANSEKYFYQNYENAITQSFEVGKKSIFLNTVPPYIIEPFTITLLFILLFIISIQYASNPEKLVASFAVIGSALFRLSPTISRIQTNLNGISSVKYIIDKFLNLCEEYNINHLSPLETKEFYHLKESLELKNINFGYTENKTVLTNINFEIKKGEFIGIAGLSGAGKTTLIDLITGLYKPNCGKILADGKTIEQSLKIGYIPQEFSIINGSIKDNVTFGASEIDDNNIVDALKKAQLYDFIIQNYPDDINSNPFVDSNGFSHGQKQRLAIARALYSNPDILILDEATSALDLKTEDEFCNVLNALKGEKTIIAIAHRLSTIKSADRIIFLKDGKIADFAPFDELIERNADFKQLVELSFLNATSI